MPFFLLDQGKILAVPSFGVVRDHFSAIRYRVRSVAARLEAITLRLT
ncbi:hypothetical protein SL1157_2902 [Ruegeria lacuscaerulensis ITI-1157]|nr:hypothetical protein SL1157_2902 [Ruegeria lacuscaerulensis ITI-1157]